jgi:hypothetical protein
LRRIIFFKNFFSVGGREDEEKTENDKFSKKANPP